MRLSNSTEEARGRSVLLLIALASILPRLSHLRGSLWNDETFSTQLRLGFDLPSLAWMAYDTHPPLYNLIMLVWISLFGDSAVAIRALPVLCSAASVFWIGRVAGLLLGRGAGPVAALLMALSGASVFYAQEARSYSLIILLFLVMAESLLLYHRRSDPRSFVRFLIFSTLCAMSHVYAFLFVLCLWVLLLLAARTPRAVVGLARSALAQAALVAPCYFLIALMILFTREHQYLWGGLTYSFGPRDASALLSFYLFGYGRLGGAWWAHALAAALFLAGAGLVLTRRPEREAPGSADFAWRGLGRLFGAGVALGLLGSLAAVAAPWWLSAEALQQAVGREKHPELITALPQLLHKTGLLYLLGYAALVPVWAAFGRPDRPGPIARLAGRLLARRRHLRLDPGHAIVALPLVAIVLVMVICYFRPTFNNRYMLALLPFALLGVTAALCRLARFPVRAALVAVVTAGQLLSLTRQDDAYALLKPDYKGALDYVSRLGRPATGTAVWELENLSRYYAGRHEIPPLTVLSRPEAIGRAAVVVFVPRAYPLEAPHLADLREAVRTRATGSRDFAGLTLYEVGPPSSPR